MIKTTMHILLIWFLASSNYGYAMTAADHLKRTPIIRIGIKPLLEEVHCEMLLRAASKNNATAVEERLNQGVSVNEQDIYGNTALHYACIFNKPSKLIDLLIRHKADVNKQNSSAQSPMHVAAKYNNVPALELLKNAGAYLRDLNCNTLCSEAANAGALEAIAWLHAAGADMNCVDRTGMTPLLAAVQCEQLPVVRQLLLHGARLDVVTQDPITPDIPNTHPPTGSTVFHLGPDLMYNKKKIQAYLLHHILFHRIETEIEPKALATLFCHLKKVCPALYQLRFELLIPKMHGNLSAQTVLSLLSCASSSKAHGLAKTLLQNRVALLKNVVETKDSNGDTPDILLYKRYKANFPGTIYNYFETFVRPELYDDNFKDLITVVQKKGSLETLYKWNIFKAAYYPHKYEY